MANDRRQLGRGSVGFGHPELVEAAVVAALTEGDGSVKRASLVLGTSASALYWFCQRHGIEPRAFHSDGGIPPEELAWVAGLFDGEGSVNLRFWANHPKCRNGSWHLMACITNTHAPTILTVRDILGFGHVTREVRPAPRRPVYDWKVAARSAGRFLRLIQPFVVTKREQVRLALDSIDIRRDNPRINRGRGRGKGGAAISPETHAQLFLIRENIKRLNGHKPVLSEIENG
mgnify:FL=1